MSAAVAAVPAPTRAIRTQKGRLKAALRYVFYGDNGTGKSTLAAHSPAPVWHDIEDGSGRLDVDRYLFRDGPGGHVPRSYSEVQSGVAELLASSHDHQSLVVDTLDRLESLMWTWLCERDGKSGIEDYGYGKGYIAALEEWRRLLMSFDRLRSERGMSIILLGHSVIRTFKNPTGEDFDRYQLRINDKAAGLIKEWADVVGFVAFEEGGSKLKGEARARGWSTGKRQVHFERSAAYDAKSRIVLPGSVDLDPTNPWAPLAAAVAEGTGLTPDEIVKLVELEIVRVSDDAMTPKVRAELKKAGKDAEALSRILNLIRTKPTKTETT